MSSRGSYENDNPAYTGSMNDKGISVISVYPPNKTKLQSDKKRLLIWLLLSLVVLLFLSLICTVVLLVNESKRECKCACDSSVVAAMNPASPVSGESWTSEVVSHRVTCNSSGVINMSDEGGQNIKLNSRANISCHLVASKSSDTFSLTAVTAGKPPVLKLPLTNDCTDHSGSRLSTNCYGTTMKNNCRYFYGSSTSYVQVSNSHYALRLTTGFTIKFTLEPHQTSSFSILSYSSNKFIISYSNNGFYVYFYYRTKSTNSWLTWSYTFKSGIDVTRRADYILMSDNKKLTLIRNGKLFGTTDISHLNIGEYQTTSGLYLGYFDSNRLIGYLCNVEIFNYPEQDLNFRFPPSNLRQLNIGSAGKTWIELGWNPPKTYTSIDGYKVTCGNKTVNINNTQAMKSNVTELLPGKLYICSIVSVKSHFKDSSAVTSFAQTAPSEVTELSAVLQDTSGYISWDIKNHVGEINGVQINITDSINSVVWSSNFCWPLKESSVSVNTLKCGEKYRISARSVLHGPEKMVTYGITKSIAVKTSDKSVLKLPLMNDCVDHSESKLQTTCYNSELRKSCRYFTGDARSHVVVKNTYRELRLINGFTIKFTLEPYMTSPFPILEYIFDPLLKKPGLKISFNGEGFHVSFPYRKKNNIQWTTWNATFKNGINLIGRAEYVLTSDNKEISLVRDKQLLESKNISSLNIGEYRSQTDLYLGSLTYYETLNGFLCNLEIFNYPESPVCNR